MDNEEFEACGPHGHAERSEWIRSHHIESLQPARGRRIEHLLRGQAGTIRQLRAPQCAVALARGSIVHARVPRQVIRQHAHLRGAAGIGIVAEGHVPRAAREFGAEGCKISSGLARNSRAEQNGNVGFRLQGFLYSRERLGGAGRRGTVSGQRAHGGGLCARRDAGIEFGAAGEFDLSGIDHVNARTHVAHGFADAPIHQRVLAPGVVTDQQDGAGFAQRFHGQRAAGSVHAESRGERGIVRGAVMVHVVGADDGAGQPPEQVVLLVCGAVRADEANSIRPVRGADGGEPRRSFFHRRFPRGRLELPVAPQHRLVQAVGMLSEIEAEPPLHA